MASKNKIKPKTLLASSKRKPNTGDLTGGQLSFYSKMREYGLTHDYAIKEAIQSINPKKDRKDFEDNFEILEYTKYY
tara:strand:+ start:1288 stop:1518 length:231 start_codon:yes stop_codon:yes gene_type:complete